MGMAASQARLLEMTSRKHDIEFALQKLSNQKVSLSRDMQEVSEDYQEALNSKVLKWSNNSGVTYIDLNYKNLMTPSMLNKNDTYLLTDMNGKVVIDSNYKKYAEMISADGGTGNWESIRTDVLASLTGIDASIIEANFQGIEDVWGTMNKAAGLRAGEPEKPLQQGSASTILGKLGSGTGVSGGFSKGDNWQEAYNQAGTINISSGNDVKNVVNYLKSSMGPYMESPEDFEAACDTFAKSYEKLDGVTGGSSAIKSDNGSYKIDVKSMVDEILGSYSARVGSAGKGGYGDVQLYNWVDIDSNEYKNWVSEHATWEEEFNSAEGDYNDTVEAQTTALTAEQESQINFYDELFSTIAEKGWTFNEKVSEPEYLNQMLQNNLYMITTVERNGEYNDDSDVFEWDNEYSTDIASNCNNIFAVSDNEGIYEAMAEYEYQKNLIHRKESQVDLKMKDLETELQSINSIIESTKKIEQENIEKNFKTFA